MIPNKDVLIIKQILSVGAIGNVKVTVWRTCILMLGSKGLNSSSLNEHLVKRKMNLLSFFPIYFTSRSISSSRSPRDG